MNLEMPEMAEMKREVENLSSMFEIFLIRNKQKATVNISDIARIEGVSLGQLRKGGTERYLLPRFGESGYPTGSVRWDLDEYLDWRKKDPNERRMAYLEHLRKMSSLT